MFQKAPAPTCFSNFNQIYREYGNQEGIQNDTFWRPAKLKKKKKKKKKETTTTTKTQLCSYALCHFC